REDRIGVLERINSEGTVLAELRQNDIKDIIKELIAKNPDSVAISLLFSFKNQVHERMLLESLRRNMKSYIVASSEVLPEFREFERTSTTVLEAYLGPLVIGYLKRLNTSIRELCPKSQLAIMQSNGGTMLASQAYGRAIGLAISGLAGGAIGGWEIARQNKVRRAITLDMGGTSCDISAILGGVTVRPDNEVGGLPLRVPSVDVKTIGAGGGSIAWVDDVGILHVGPQSAGAIPGPAAYGKGGDEATVTDANLIIGRLNPDYFLGGKIKLHKKRAQTAVSRTASKLGLTMEETALGIIRISTANMVQAIREVTIERGADPRNYVLVPFGGAGPTQAVDIAESLGISQVLVPPHPGITSALGLVCTDLRVDLMKTVLMSATLENQSELISEIHQLNEEAERRLSEQGVSGELKVKLDMRYSGQSHELSIDILCEAGSKDLVRHSIERFEGMHRDLFGYNMPGLDVEWVTVRAIATGISDAFRPFQHNVTSKASPIGSRQVLIAPDSVVEANIYRRFDLSVGQSVGGPSIIEQLDTTTFVAPGWFAKQTKDGTLWMRRGEL
ncbi:MAG: hydantoinase/oxoprolinase family protein, partial [Candidatus Thorarchaeota archaeon]